MTEMMIAVVILGIGLLITASMFPIAWYKAKEVAQATYVPTAGDSAETMLTFLTRASKPLERPPAARATSFMAGDWLPPFDPVKEHYEPAFFSDTRVHALNLGNYLADGANYLKVQEPDLLGSTSDLAPVGDNPWTIDDAVLYRAWDPDYRSRILGTQLHWPVMAPHLRLLPAMPARPEPTLAQFAGAYRHWSQVFEGRRYCFGVLYRFSILRGPRGDANTWALCGSGTGQFGTGLSDDCAAAVKQFEQAPMTERRMTIYYVTMKRPAGARYARQLGYTRGSSTWAAPPLHPQAMPPASDVLLPSPWRIEAKLLNVPARGAPPTGIPSQIEVNDPVLSVGLQEGAYLVDDQTGQVFHVTRALRPNPAQANLVHLTLSGEYLASEIVDDPNGPRVPAVNLAPLDWTDVAENWLNAWHCTSGTAGCNAFSMSTYNPARRFYWFYPPPVDASRATLFDGSPPVISIETREVVLPR